MNINNQTEYKKLFGSRLFILITVCMIVVAMAAPAFAAEATLIPFPSQLPIGFIPYPEGADLSLYQDIPSDLVPPYSSDQQVLAEIRFYAVRNHAPRLIVVGLNASTVVEAFEGAAGQISFQITGYEYCYTYGAGGWGNMGDISLTVSPDYIISLPVEVYLRGSGELFYSPPPPPDLGEDVTRTLPIVLSWIQQTLNALFVEGGALQGLLLLVAVPVAITLVFLGARFIRNLIWGA